MTLNYPKRILQLTWLLSILLLVNGCKKSTNSCNYSSPTQVATSAEIDYLSNYNTTNSLNLLQHPSGIFFRIDSAGVGNAPSVCSIVRVNYEGKLLNGSRFDWNNSAAGITFTLGELILGWQYALPLIKQGGSLTVYIPPSLGYGSRNVLDNTGGVVIPANSYLHFTILLREIQ